VRGSTKFEEKKMKVEDLRIMLMVLDGKTRPKKE
jgi:hypothetical protein